MNKILFLTNMYPSKKAPSYGIFVKKTYQWLHEFYQVKLIKICKNKNIAKKIYAYFVFYTMAIFHGIFFHYDCVYAHFISHCALPIKIIRFFHKDIVIVGNIHGEDAFSEYEKYQKNRKRACIFLKNCNYIIAPSCYFKDKLCDEYGFDKKRVFVSPSGGVDTNYFIPKDIKQCKQKFGFDISKKYIGMVSRIEDGKGWDVFIKAAKMIKHENTEFVIVGSGSKELEMKEMIEDEGIQNKITLLPMMGHDKLPDIYASLDIFCFPTNIVWESLGLVGLEAMSCKIPCIISSMPGPSSYCKQDNCLRFEPKDAYQLTTKIIELLNMDSDNLMQMKENARKTALEYDSRLVKQDFLKFFERVMQNDT